MYKFCHCCNLPDTSLEKGLLRKDRQGTSLGKAVSRTNQRKKRSKQKRDQEEEQAIGGKDASLFLFRALGKILHCKRGSYVPVSTQVSPPHQEGVEQPELASSSVFRNTSQ